MSTETSNKENFNKAFNLESTNKYEVKKKPGMLKNAVSKIFKKKEHEEKYVEPFMIFLNRIYRSKQYYKYKYINLYYMHLLACIGIILVFFVGITYNLIKINILKYKSKWPQIRCEPSFLLLAGIINPIPGKTQSEMISENFNYCTTETLNGIVDTATAPGRASVAALARIQQGMLETADAFRNEINKHKENIVAVFTEIYEKLMEFLAPIRKLLIQGKVVLDKIMGVVISMFYIFQLMITSIKSALRIVLGYLTALIVAAVVIAIIALIAAYLWFIFPVIVPATIVVIFMAVMVGFLIPITDEFDGALRIYNEIKKNN